jgi:hypothetical protein
LGTNLFWEERNLFLVTYLSWEKKAIFGARTIGGKKETCRMWRKRIMEKKEENKNM